MTRHTLIASNLGQIIGRLMYQADDVAAPALEPKPAWRGARARQILELVRNRGSVSTPEVAAALGISGNNATVTMLTMYRRGELKRSGEQKRYRYSLP